ncbi:MAG: F0F1 ATP synthase subunit delta [Kordiimonas sp.]|nr:F0F1 ATP synthase subunit delta [Kordiimonas sp.]
MSSEQAPNSATQRVSVSGLAGRYAVALFDLAQENDALADIANDLDTVATLIRDSEDFASLINSPILSRAEQGAAIVALAQELKLNALLGNFLGVVAQNRRLPDLGKMIEALHALLAQFKGEVSATVTSAQSLTDAQLSALKDKLKSLVGRDVNVETKIDAELLGGLVVNIGSRMIDSSLRTKLANLEESMKEVG